MTLSEYAESARTRYLDFYRQQLTQLRAAQSASAFELLIKPDGATDPEPFCLMRVDAIYQEEGAYKLVRVALNNSDADGDDEGTAGPEAGNGLSFEVGDSLRVTSAESLSWEAVTVSFRSPTFGMEMLENWLTKWLDVKELRKADATTGLAGVVHFIGWTQPATDAEAETEAEAAGHAWEILVDFGSAPVEALLELLAIVAGCGVREVHLETRTETQ